MTSSSKKALCKSQRLRVNSYRNNLHIPWQCVTIGHMERLLAIYYCNVNQAAEQVGVTRQTISRWLKSGRMVADWEGKEKLIPKWIVELERSKHESISLSKG